MECGFIRENLFAIAEKQLGEEELTRVEAHLEACSRCRKEVDFFTGLETEVRRAKEAEPSPFIATRTLAMLESRFITPVQRRSVHARFILQPAVISFFMGLAILAGILFGRFGYRQHDQAATASETEMLKSELVLEEVVAEEPGLMMME